MIEKDNFFERYRDQCEKCNNGNAVVIPANDPDNGQYGDKIDILFINERPGRIGPGETGIVSFDNPDPTAQRCKRLFTKTFSLEYRKNIFITNACLWYPDDLNYIDKPPTTQELTCSTPTLKDQIEEIKPSLIISLGNTALKALKIIYPKSNQLMGYTLQGNIGELISDTYPIIYPVYHTSNRAKITRSEEQQKKDWGKIPKLIKC